MPKLGRAMAQAHYGLLEEWTFKDSGVLIPNQGQGLENCSLPSCASGLMPLLPNQALTGRGGKWAERQLLRGRNMERNPSPYQGFALLILTFTRYPGRSKKQEGFFLPTRGSSSCLKD